MGGIRMNEAIFKAKVELAQKIVQNLDEPLKIEAFKIVLNKLLDGKIETEISISTDISKKDALIVKCTVCGAQVVIRDIPQGTTLETILNTKPCMHCGMQGNWKKISQF